MKYSGVYGVYMKEKDKKRLALHTLGFTSENPELLRKRYPDKKELSIRTEIGTFGLESTFDEFLLPEQDTKLLYHVDGRGNPLFGMDVKYTAEAHSFYPPQVQTTMDVDMQREMENVLKAQGVEKGGAVLLDIQNSSVLAMASVPNVTSKNRHEARNYMLTAMAPGSVFKTVVLAAPIEKNLNQPQTMYDCRKNLYGEPEGKQEVLNLSESFAQSCNYTFATLAESDSSKQMIKSLKRQLQSLGLWIEPAGKGMYTISNNSNSLIVKKQAVCGEIKETSMSKKPLRKRQLVKKMLKQPPYKLPI